MRVIEVTQADLTPRTPSPVKGEDLVEVVVEEGVEEVPSMEAHVTVAVTTVAPAAGFHFMRESELAPEAEASYDEQV